MKNKLVFPEGGLEPKYLWDRHSIQNEGVHKWDKFNTERETTYFWDKYKVNAEKRKYKKYSLKEQQGEGIENIKGDYLETVVGEIGEYPDNGILDGYWYVLDAKATWSRYYKSTGVTSITVEKYNVSDKGVTIEFNQPVSLTYDETSSYDISEFITAYPDSLIQGGYQFYYLKPNGEIGKTSQSKKTSSWGEAFSAQGIYNTPLMSLGYTIGLSKCWWSYYHGRSYTQLWMFNKDTTCDGEYLNPPCYYQYLNSPNEVDTSYAYPISWSLGNSGNGLNKIYFSDIRPMIGEPLETMVVNKGDQLFNEIRGSIIGKTAVSGYEFLANGYLDRENNIFYKVVSSKTGPMKGSYYGSVSGVYGDYPDNGVDGSFYYELDKLEFDSFYYWDKFALTTTSANYKYKKYNTFPKRWVATPYNKQLYLEYTASEPLKAYSLDDFLFSMRTEVLGDNGEFITTQEDSIIRLFRADMSYVDMSGVEFVRTYANGASFPGHGYTDDTRSLYEKSGFVGFTYGNEFAPFDDRPQYWFRNDTKAGIYYGSTTEHSWIQYLAIKGNFYAFFDRNYVGPVEDKPGFKNYKSASLWGLTATKENNGSSYIELPNVSLPDFNTDTLKIVYGYNKDFPDEELHTDGWYYRLDVSYDGTEIDYSQYEVVESNNNTTYPDGGMLNGYYYEYLEHSISQNPGNLINGVIANAENEYPNNGVLNGYYYIKRNTATIYQWNKLTTEDGELVEKLYSWKENTYPTNGYANGYYYQRESDIASGSITERGDYIESISNTSNLYPQDGIQGGYWYVFTNAVTNLNILDKVDSIQDEKKTAFPMNGLMNNYWFKYVGFETNGPYKSYKIDQVETNKQDSYPLNGIQGNYWYVYNSTYDGYKVVITDDKIRNGITYQHCINPDEDYTIGGVASAQITFDYDNRDEDIDEFADYDYCDYYTWQSSDTGWRLIGRFYLDNISHKRNIVKCQAFDAIGTRVEAFVDDFIANTSYPISVIQFFNNLCNYLDIEGVIGNDLINTDYVFNDTFQAINITARQLLQYIAEITGGFIKATQDGRLYLTTYENRNISLNNSKYTRASIANYETAFVDGVTIKANTDDLGVSAGSNEGNLYIIENNPILYADTPEQIQTQANNLYVILRNISYTPAEVELLTDYGINCGDIITLNNKDFYVMDKEITVSGCKLKCLGNKERLKQASSLNSDIIALRGKTNELYRDLEQTVSTLTDKTNGLQSQITQTAEKINLRVTNEVEGLESQITQTAEQISSRVTNEVAGLESKITQTADSITSTVTDEINQAKSEIKQTTDSISLEVQNQGDLVAQLVLDVDGISARGYVTFTDLAGSGTTTINGSNITTGTISADRINLKGAISWGDLDDDCQDTIASYAGADGSDADVPDYIQPTYIDAIRIMSPTIQGGTISAGTKAEGYMKMSSSGMNFKSSTGGNLLGIGFYPGRYNFPYIIFGDGVDSVGTDRGMIKKYSWGMWIGDNDGQQNDEPTGTGLMIDFKNKRLLMYKDGVSTVL